MGNTYLGQGQEGDPVWVKCDLVWAHIHILQVVTFGTFEIPLLSLKISYFFFYLLLQLFNFNIIPYTYMCYVFLRNDLLSPQPPKKNLHWQNIQKYTKYIFYLFCGMKVDQDGKRK